jgi:uncharacterized membrane protein YhaH (DUF805 family)
MLGSISRDLFGDLSHGRLARLPFLLYLVGGLILLLPLALLFAGTVGAFAASSGNDLKWLLYPFVSIVAFVAANVVSKRIRDIGLPGWTTFVGINVLSFVMMYVVPEVVLKVLSALIYLALFFAPSDAVKAEPCGIRDRRQSEP